MQIFFFPFCNYITATLIASFQNCYETKGPNDTVCKSSSWRSPPRGSPCPKSGGKETVFAPLGEDRRGLKAARAGEEKWQISLGPPKVRRFNRSPIGKRNRNFTLRLQITR